MGTSGAQLVAAHVPRACGLPQAHGVPGWPWQGQWEACQAPPGLWLSSLLSARVCAPTSSCLLMTLPRRTASGRGHQSQRRPKEVRGLCGRGRPASGAAW